MEYIRDVLSRNLLSLRKSKGLTQLDIANVLDLTSASYNRIENGISWPDPIALEKLASFYGVRSSAFFYDSSVDFPVQDIEPPVNKREIIKKLEELIDQIKK